MPWLETSGSSTTAPTSWQSTATGSPTTWTQLFAMAKKIRTASRANPQFSGFVFQGTARTDLRRARGSPLERRTVHRRRQVDQQPEGSGDPRPVPQEHRRPHRAVTSYQEGEAHTAFVTGKRVHAQLAVRVLDRGRPEAVEGRRQVQRDHAAGQPGGHPWHRGRLSPSTSTRSTRTRRSSSSVT